MAEAWELAINKAFNKVVTEKHANETTTSASTSNANEAPVTATEDAIATPPRPTNPPVLPSTPSKAPSATNTKKTIDPVEAIRQRIVSLEAGSPVSKPISKRDPLAIDRKKRTKSRQKPYICPGKNLCKSLLCAHEADNARQEQERLSHLVAVVKKKFEVQEKKTLSTTYVNNMLIENNDALVPAINAIKADLEKRLGALESTGRMTFTGDPVVRQYSYSELLCRNIYMHFDMAATSDYDMYLTSVEKHQQRLFDLMKNKQESYLAKDLKKSKKSPHLAKAMCILYTIEAKLMAERARLFTEAKARGEEGDILNETLRRFDESIWTLDWVKERIDSVFTLTKKHLPKKQADEHLQSVSNQVVDSNDSAGDNMSVLASDGSNADDEERTEEARKVADAVFTEEEVMDLLQIEAQARDDYSFSCMTPEMEMESIIINTGPFATLCSEDAIKKLMKEDKNRSDSKTKKLARATLQYQRQQEIKHLERERLEKICKQMESNVKEQHRQFQELGAKERATRNAADVEVEKFKAAEWVEYFKEDTRADEVFKAR